MASLMVLIALGAAAFLGRTLVVRAPPTEDGRTVNRSSHVG